MDCEVFLLTDNLVVENAFYKGSSSSVLLFGLVLRLRKVKLEGKSILHMIHLSGKRMIASGIDPLSRGDTTRGVMQGNSLLSYFPFHLEADQRSNTLVPWIKSWWRSDRQLIHLSKERWFDEVFAEGNYLWTPPPAVAQVSVEQLCRNYHLREKSCHIVCLPVLMTFLWRNQLSKVANLIVTLPFDEVMWSRANHEHLILVIVFTFANRRPWKL